MYTNWENGSENNTGVASAIVYVNDFKEMQGPLERPMDESLATRQRLSALGVILINYAERTFPATDGRLVGTDNFYTRHVLAQ